jgi:hypothetical protein
LGKVGEGGRKERNKRGNRRRKDWGQRDGEREAFFLVLPSYFPLSLFTAIAIAIVI